MPLKPNLLFKPHHPTETTSTPSQILKIIKANFKMTTNIDTILILGATSGRAFARYFHAKGKKVIAAGRRQD